MSESVPAREVFERVFQILEAMEENQRQKVIELARRLKPGLTAEDIRNPHDFPDLDDPDWHFEDGQLTGIQSALFALRAMSRDVLGDGEAAQSEGGEAKQLKGEG
ncbi:MAG TPA: hypothetical protein VE093_02705 [Polyangiaceae bacterium]|jgi:hypothetical protein|nr:hypothetical protein [Polyangiaceae bacterium]